MRWIIGLIIIVIFTVISCSGSGGGGPFLVAYNSVYAVNALSTDENILLHVGDEAIETVLHYDENASIIEEAVGSNNITYYTVTGGNELGHTSLENSRTYFYAATDCDNGTISPVEALAHQVENDYQMKIINTSNTPWDTNVHIGGGIVIGGVTDACSVRAIPWVVGDNTITVVFAGTTYSKQIPENTSFDIVIYNVAAEKAAIIPLPRLTADAL